MSGYLDHLAVRILQPELMVQPRLVTRFESPRHAIFPAPEIATTGEADEQESQPAVFMPSETSADKPTPQVDSHTPDEAGIMDSLSESRPAKKSHKSYPEQSPAEPPIGTLASRTETTYRPLPEVAPPAPGRRSAEQRKRVTRSDGLQIQPSIKDGRLEEQTDMTSPPPSQRQKSSAPMESATHKLLINPPEVIVSGSHVLRRAQYEQTIRNVDQAPSVHPELVEGRTEATLTATPTERAWIQPPVRVEQLERQKSSSILSQTALNGDVRPKSEFAPVPGREIFKPHVEPTARQFVTDRTAEAPTIQVTIGRVEIRATVASTPTRKTPTQSPVMSLDEYLKQRNGGRG